MNHELESALEDAADELASVARSLPSLTDHAETLVESIPKVGRETESDASTSSKYGGKLRDIRNVAGQLKAHADSLMAAADRIESA